MVCLRGNSREYSAVSVDHVTSHHIDFASHAYDGVILANVNACRYSPYPNIVSKDHMRTCIR